MYAAWITTLVTCLRRVTLLDMPVGAATLSQTAKLGTTSGSRS